MFARSRGIKTLFFRILGSLIMIYSYLAAFSWIFSRDPITIILIYVFMLMVVFIFGIGITSIYPDILLDHDGIQYRACYGFVHDVIKWEEVGGIVSVGKEKKQWAVLINRKNFRVYWPGKLFFNMIFAVKYGLVQPIILISNELENFETVVEKIKEKALNNVIYL